ncbi:MAG: SMC-Scp complex subunit ScpB [Actinobacteria bacterium]|nr:SMC-Scp complex subunit ScpB [Actinomycetota bacterium]
MKEYLTENEKKAMALLVAARDNLHITSLKQALNMDKKEIRELLKSLENKFLELNLPFKLIEVEDSFGIAIDEETSIFLNNFFKSSSAQKSLSRAALETLAVIAVHQPITRRDIARIRGVAPDSSLATLMESGLIDRIDVKGKTCFVTTKEFLKATGFKSLNEFKKMVEKLNNE